MLAILKAVILGIVEGITEFLPISSTGHLILVNQWIYFSEQFTKMFDIVIQLGAILAIVVLFWSELLDLRAKQAQRTFQLWLKVIVGVVPALVFGFLLNDLIEKVLFNPLTVALALTVGGVILIALENLYKKDKIKSINALTFQTAFFIGVIQCLAMIPGTSRSAATIIGAMLLGCSRVVAAKFSFFLAIPTMLAASTFSFFKVGLHLTAQELIVLAVGFVTSFIVAWLVVAGFMKFISKNNFKPFGWYRIILGSLILALIFLKIL